MSILWNEKNLKRLLVDMHIPDWNSEFMSQYSAEKMAELMKLSGTDVAQFSASSCLGLCFWPTKVGYPHQCLNGRDLLGDTLRAYREKGMKTQVFLNTWSRRAYDLHPEWRMIMPNGKGTVHNHYWESGRYGLCCPNTGYGDFFIELVKEVVSTYETDGYWFDMVGCWDVICCCPVCRAKFAEQNNGAQIPEKIDWNDPLWNAFAKFREESVNDFVQRIRDVVKTLTPDRTVAFQTGALHAGWNGAGNQPDFYRCGDYLAHDLTGEKFEQIYCSKMYTALTKTHPVEFMVSRCIHLSHHTTSRSQEEISTIAYAAIANQTSFTLIDALDPIGTVDDQFYHNAAVIFKKYGQYGKYIHAATRPVADCAIYYSRDSQLDVRNKGDIFNIEKSLSPNAKRYANIAKTLSEKHILFSFADSESDLSRFPALILSDCSRMSEEECNKIREYVAAGGSLYVSADTSLFDPSKGMRKDFALADLLGVHTHGEITQKVTYIAPRENTLPAEYCSYKYPVMLEGAQTKISQDTVEVLGTLTLPCSDALESDRFGSAISNPPWVWTDAPALTINRYGKGKVIYCAGKLEENIYPVHRDLFAGLVTSLSGQMIRTNAAPWVECTLFEYSEEKCFYLSLLNRPADLPPPALYEIKVELTLPQDKKVVSVLLGPDDKEIPFKVVGTTLSITVEKLEEFDVVIIKYQ